MGAGGTQDHEPQRLRGGAGSSLSGIRLQSREKPRRRATIKPPVGAVPEKWSEGRATGPGGGEPALESDNALVLVLPSLAG